MKLAIAIIHGIGVQKHDYADDFINKIKESYRKSGKNPDEDLLFVPIYWQNLLSSREKELFRKLESKTNWKGLRSFFINFAADALVYQPSEQPNSVYKDIHRVIDRTFKEIYKRIPIHTPLAIISHSLGTVIASNFLWDCQNPTSDGAKNTEISIESISLASRLSLFVTMGSPLPVWSLRFPGGGKPITFPGETALVSSIWLNLYSKNDIIGHPLKSINHQYYKLDNLVDKSIRVGGIFTFWNPACHMDYWTSKKVITLITELILGMTSSIWIRKECE